MTPLHHSDFEKNVIMKNIEERKKMERELGLYNLSADMRNIDKPTSTFQEHWTILWEMMSRLKERYMCVLLYACILQKLFGHWAMQVVIICKYLVSKFSEF